MEEKFAKLRLLVHKELSSSAHDLDHVTRVYNLCMRLAESEPDIDLEVLRTAALLHDIARVKEDQDDSGSTDHSIVGAKMADSILRDLQYSEDAIERIKHCIVAHRYRTDIRPETKEARILSDADKLDAIGAIGIGRAFMIAGEYDEKLFSDVPLKSYIQDNVVDGKPDGRIRDLSRHSPNLEYEMKLKHIPAKLHTAKAKEIADARLEFMNEYFDRLRKEIRGES